MIELIDIAAIKEFKGITSNLNVQKELSPHILEAQEFDLRQFMGESFYIDLIEKATAGPLTGDMKDLFDGKIYTYLGEKFEHKGLKSVLCYHTWARYQTEANTTSTPHGMVNKLNPHSTFISDKATARLIAQARSGAEAHARRVKEFLDRNSTLFPLWKCSTGKRYKTGVKIKRIG